VKTIAVKLKDRRYRVLLGRGWLHRAGKEIVRELGKKPPSIAVVTSPTVRKHWGTELEKGLIAAKLPFDFIEIDDGEQAKNLESVEGLLRKFSQLRLDRSSVVLAFGGGVIGDAVGFAASIYMRGVDVIQIPTTLLAQVDAAIGGKTGVNLPEGKNLVGTFHQPRAVLVDAQVLSTLSDREFRAGLFEVIKCGIIGDKELFEFCEKRMDSILAREPKALLRIIAASAQLKAEIVARDEREGGLRRILNFGHTVGHALEAESSYSRFLHGEAVGWGTIAAANIGVACGVTPVKVADRIGRVIESVGLLPSLTADAAKIVKLVQGDKKTVAGVPHFVLAKSIGKVEITAKVKPAQIEAAVSQLRERSAAFGR
jgi:3-dehydroquinate synthase